MRFRLLMVFLYLFLPNHTQADDLNYLQPVVIIDDDLGGVVDDYNNKFEEYQKTNTLVIINGDCISACARFQKLKSVCATDKGYFFFHGLTIDNKLSISDGITDSMETDNAKGFALEKKYNTFSFWLTRNKPYNEKQVERGVSIVYVESDNGLYQKFLKVKATKIIRACHT